MLGKFKPLIAEGQSAPRPYLQEGLEIARRIDHKQITMFALGALGIVAETDGDLKTAQIHYQEALDYAQAMGHMTSIADHLNLLGRVSYQLGQTERALQDAAQVERRGGRLPEELRQRLNEAVQR